jgi:hypothetical protein
MSIHLKVLKRKVRTRSNKVHQLKNEPMKTAIISIPTCAASVVLKSLHEHNVRCEYVGIDQVGRILMQVTYETVKETLIEELILYMSESEQTVSEIKEIMQAAIQKKREKN